MTAYTLHHGAALSPAEAAHLLARAAQGDALTHAPVKEGTGYVLAHLATLSAQQLAAHRAQVLQLAQRLSLFAGPGLSA